MQNGFIDKGKFEQLAAQLPPDGFLRLEHLATNKKKGRIGITGLSEPTIWRRSREGTFPEAVQIGARATGWRIAEVRQWLDNPAGYRQPATQQVAAVEPTATDQLAPVKLAKGEAAKSTTSAPTTTQPSRTEATAIPAGEAKKGTIKPGKPAAHKAKTLPPAGTSAKPSQAKRAPAEKQAVSPDVATPDKPIRRGKPIHISVLAGYKNQK